MGGGDDVEGGVRSIAGTVWGIGARGGTGGWSSLPLEVGCGCFCGIYVGGGSGLRGVGESVWLRGEDGFCGEDAQCGGILVIVVVVFIIVARGGWFGGREDWQRGTDAVRELTIKTFVGAGHDAVGFAFALFVFLLAAPSCACWTCLKMVWGSKLGVQASSSPKIVVMLQAKRIVVGSG